MAKEKKGPIPKTVETITREINTNPTAPIADGIGGLRIKSGTVIKDISEYGYAVPVGETANFPGHVHSMLIEKGYIK